MSSQSPSRKTSNFDSIIQVYEEVESQDEVMTLLQALLEYEKDLSKCSRSISKSLIDVSGKNDSLTSRKGSVLAYDFDPVRLCPSDNGASKPPPRRFYL